MSSVRARRPGMGKERQVSDVGLGSDESNSVALGELSYSGRAVSVL